MTYKEIAGIISQDYEIVEDSRRTFRSENLIFSIIKMEYDFKNNQNTAVLIDSDLSYFIHNSELKDLDSKCMELGVSLSDIINICISQTHTEIYKTEFNIPFLNKLNIKVLYQELGEEKFFIIQKKIVK